MSIKSGHSFAVGSELSLPTSASQNNPTSSVLQTSRAAATYNRRRAGNACLVCRGRKTKCDNQRPVCGFCAVTGGNCVYVETDNSQLDRASLAILARISELETNLTKQINESLRKQENNVSTAFDIPSVPSQETSSSSIWHDFTSSGDIDVTSDVVAAALPSPVHTTQHYSSMKQSRALEDDSSSGMEGDMPPSSDHMLRASEMSLESVLTWRTFASIHQREDGTRQASLLEISGRRGPLKTPSPDSISSVFVNLDSATLNYLVENFLANNHIKNPILDIEQLRNDARAFAESGPQWDSKTCLILLVCAVSSLSTPLTDELRPGPSRLPDRILVAEAYFQSSQRRIGMLYHEDSLIATQCSFLTGVYLMLTMRVLAAWKAFVQAGTQCLAWLSSNSWVKRSSTHSDPRLRPLEAEEFFDRDPRTRHVMESLYWSCLKSEQELSFELALPASALNEMLYLHLFPSPPSQLPNSRSQSPPDLLWPATRPRLTALDQRNLESGWFFYLAEIAMRRIYNRALLWRYGSKRKMDHASLQAGVIEFERQVQEWHENLPPSMNFPDDLRVPTGDILRCILRTHMTDGKLTLRFPAIHAFLDDPASAWKDLDPITRKLAREHLVTDVQHLDANRENFYHRHQGTWLMLRSCSKCALFLVAAAVKCRAEEALWRTGESRLEDEVLPPAWKDAVIDFHNVLNYWLDEVLEVKLTRDLIEYFMQTYESLT